MATLHVDLQAGFDDEDVYIRIDDREALVHRGATTDYSVGLAATGRQLDVAPGDHVLEVTIPERSLAARETVTVTDDLYVAVNAGDELTITTQVEPFRYF